MKNTLQFRFGTGDIDPFAEEAKRRGERLKTYREWFVGDDETMSKVLVGQYIGVQKFAYILCLEDVRRWLFGMGQRILAKMVGARISAIDQKRNRGVRVSMETNLNRTLVLEEIAVAAELLLDDPDNAADHLERLAEGVETMKNWKQKLRGASRRRGGHETSGQDCA